MMRPDRWRAVQASFRAETATMREYAIRRFPERVLDAILKMSRTRANYWLEFVLDTALGVILLSEGLWRHTNSFFDAAMFVLLGLFIFSFMEYFFHRWLFHGSLRLLAQGHTSHHDNPNGYDSLPFFVPALVLFALIEICEMLIPGSDSLLLASGIAIGYVIYGTSHFVIHHMRFRHSLIRSWAAFHHIHHYHPDRNFGVTSPLWDVLLGTRYVTAQNLAPRTPDIPPQS